MDVVSGGFTTVNTVTAVAATAALVTVGSAGTTGGITTVLEISGGVLREAKAISATTTLTAAVDYVDKLSELSKGGNTVAFEMKGDSYLFIQGGTVGSTADDTVIKFTSTGLASVTTTGTKITLA